MELGTRCGAGIIALAVIGFTASAASPLQLQEQPGLLDVARIASVELTERTLAECSVSSQALDAIWPALRDESISERTQWLELVDSLQQISNQVQNLHRSVLLDPASASLREQLQEVQQLQTETMSNLRESNARASAKMTEALLEDSLPLFNGHRNLVRESGLDRKAILRAQRSERRSQQLGTNAPPEHSSLLATLRSNIPIGTPSATEQVELQESLGASIRQRAQLQD